MDDAKREKIAKEAKEILDKFSHAIEAVKLKAREEKRELGGFREEGEGKICDTDFRARMFANAPEKDEDYIYAEKKTW